ncbi:type II toxin-antitoxin system HipA family toxin [Emcibacter nanhaiensis]|uniref:Type II toxin-antitoxin system HipA family toxin n=1 Tax=Emcibacter nanhaiensis TaxID=1505037 RepID=A0A501P9D3_9PROT|nr:type II toxin-antitoxin system HipA family toxin [Emcibacter nanhaiensis]TPD56838.1 type II toxin-antitoxin system HipA family toxin [Emcibacter nanhaiensis]
MGRKRRSHALDLYVGLSKVGTYTRASTGATSFRYDEDWLVSKRAFPISLSLPLSDRIWSGDSIASVFDGLLPDDQAVREAIAAREGADSAGTFDLLTAIGRDCVGALRFVPEGEDPGEPTKMTYRPISDAEISRRLASLARAPLGMAAHRDNGEEDFRISIAGMQEKTAFLYAEDRWQLPLGATPTSHIFKPAMREGPNGADFSDSPWNEWFCLKLCEGFGLASAGAEVQHFNNKPVIIVKRFDRRWQDGVLYRLPQEDLCQALGVSPARKYESDGGPGILSILEFLNQAASPRADRLTFFKAQIVFWLLAAIDGHAKNFSIFLTPGGFRLTPMYDVMSAAPYPELTPQKIKLAMAIGDNRHYRVHEIVPRHFYQMGKTAGFAKVDVDEMFDAVGQTFTEVLEDAVSAADKACMPANTRDAIVEGVLARAKLVT